MKGTPNTLGYSADVRMHLHLNGFVLKIGQLGPGFIIMRNAPAHPPGDAEIVVSIDGDESRWNVFLPDGISPDNVRTKIA